ncbi:hypothetical protein [Streptomyces sp. NPDC021356]|uniref:hypothetical protein n=1 Tax=Streptomyces sp. NPDC021356 TaxID=3154900 RepID=UPI0033E94F8D
MIVVALPGCSRSQPPQSVQPTLPTHKTVKHTFYGYDPEEPAHVQREVLSWTSQDDDGPINGTYVVQDRADATGRWTDTSDPKPYQGTQRGNEIDVPAGQLVL